MATSQEYTLERKTGANTSEEVQIPASSVSGLANVATSGSYNDLSNTPTIPDVSGKQDKLTAGSNITISGNTISATVPTDVVKYTAQTLTTAQKTQARSNIGAGTSSFSGSYNDLTNKPTIPTVNNGTLTIQKNGTTVATFSANQSGNATANITVPTFSLSGTTLTITL